MKRILLVVIGVLFFISESSFAQGIYGGIRQRSAYTPMQIESKENEQVRKSHNHNIGYSTYSGERQYISAEFKCSDGNIAFELCQNGFIYDHKRKQSGYYCIGEQSGYKIFKVYIRWCHGGETWGTLNYSERTDGRPKFRVKIGSSMYVYQPLLR